MVFVAVAWTLLKGVFSAGARLTHEAEYEQVSRSFAADPAENEERDLTAVRKRLVEILGRYSFSDLLHTELINILNNIQPGDLLGIDYVEDTDREDIEDDFIYAIEHYPPTLPLPREMTHDEAITEMMAMRPALESTCRALFYLDASTTEYQVLDAELDRLLRNYTGLFLVADAKARRRSA